MLLILGCGKLGRMVASRWSSGPVIGVRRGGACGEPGPGDEVATRESPRQRMLTGDISDPGFWSSLPGLAGAAELPWPAAQVLLAASPGLRRGRDNGLAAAATLIRRHLPRARVVYSGTCAVYADAGGAPVDERGAVAQDDPAIAGLLAIEEALLPLADALVLRLPALVGPARSFARERLISGERTVRGSLDRPFPFLNEADAAELCVQALGGAFGTGILNAASPQRLTMREYYRQLAAAAGVPEPDGDHSAVRSRAIDAGRLWSMLPGRSWRGPADPP